MSSREPMWYCHECNAEMRPLMVPDPTCASCHGSFVEKMENPADDPREFRHGGPDIDTEGLLGIEQLLSMLQPRTGPFSGGMHRMSVPSSRPISEPNGITFQIRSTGSGPRTVTIGRPSQHGEIPTMSDRYLRRGSEPGSPGITGPLMAQYLMALLGQRDSLTELFARGMGELPGESGRMGDYVFGQEALDQIITQLMENSNSHRPVAATNEIIEDLPREVLELNSPTLEKDCAVCKEQFKLETEDPDEQIVVTLPCKHPFHEGCILPWLKSSGTCPVCRYALIAQPEHSPTTAPGSGPGGSGARPGSPSRSRPPRPPRPGSPGRTTDNNSMFTSFFGQFHGGNGSGRGNGNSSRSGRTGSNPGQRPGGPNHNVPGSWNEDLD